MAEKTKKFDFNELNTLAVVSLASALSLFGAPAAVITGHVALQQLKTSDQKGRWMALVGVVLGYVGIASAILFAVLGTFLRLRHGYDYGCMHMYDFMCRDHEFKNYPMPLPSYTPMPMPTYGPDMNGN